MAGWKILFQSVFEIVAIHFGATLSETRPMKGPHRVWLQAQIDKKFFRTQLLSMITRTQYPGERSFFGLSCMLQ
jgi:hypothetical protein